MVLWRPIKIKEQLFVVKFEHNSNKVACHLSNFENVWRDVLDVPLVLKRAQVQNLNFLFIKHCFTVIYRQDENPLVEYSENTIIDTLLSPANDYQLNQEVSSETQTVFRLKYYVSSLPFLFFWNMVQCSSEIVSSIFFYIEIENKGLLIRLSSLKKSPEHSWYH